MKFHFTILFPVPFYSHCITLNHISGVIHNMNCSQSIMASKLCQHPVNQRQPNNSFNNYVFMVMWQCYWKSTPELRPVRMAWKIRINYVTSTVIYLMVSTVHSGVGHKSKIKKKVVIFHFLNFLQINYVFENVETYISDKLVKK